MQLSDPVTSLAGIGQSFATKLARLGIFSIFDLLYHLPFRYEDRTQKTTISQLSLNQAANLTVKLLSIKNDYTKTGKVIQLAKVADATGEFTVVWFNQPFLIRNLKIGSHINLFGKTGFWSKKLALISPGYEPGNGSIHSQGLVPIYPETAGITSKWFRTKIHALLELLPDDFIPGNEFSLPNWKTSLRSVHFPSSLDVVTQATSRLAFDELFLLQLVNLLHKSHWYTIKLAHQLTIDPYKLSAFHSSLPFTLTSSQNTAIAEIISDMRAVRPMNRLLIGDVGSGKTIVAATAAYLTSLNSLQTVILAPTQILAQQHFETLTTIFQSLNIPVVLITSQTELVTDYRLPNTILVGTHALLNTKLNLSNVGLVVIDEQHRFGVLQRTLAATLGQSPHTLTMSATPIPRTVALTRFGDLDLSILDDRPRKAPLKTWLVPETKRTSAYKWLNVQMLNDKSQLFWVCPFVADSESQATIKSATTHFTKIQTAFPRLRVGLLHGRLKPADKQKIIQDFVTRKYDILVTTPIIEVGIDVPNATLIVIESAERFGLAALHQLRGRVGRGALDSYCLLFSESQTDRLRHLESISSGPQLAEIDLKLRGVGDIYGVSQHGNTKYFKVAAYDHFYLVPKAKLAAEKLLPQLDKMPLLQSLVQKVKIALVKPN